MVARMFRKLRMNQRLGVVDTFQFPEAVRYRFALQHPGLADDASSLVEAAIRQWFRLAARHPKATLSMPSVVVDDLWQELVLHTREYATFCQAAFGRNLHRVPESPMSATPDRAARLRHTLDLARHDEGCGPRGIPLLFRIDRELGTDGGNAYVPDCGGHGECYEVSGKVCLQHLTGLDSRPQPGRSTPGAGPPNPYQWPNQGMGPA
jgi:hypothetical protein